MKIKNSILLSIICLSSVYSQEFSDQATIDTINKTGFFQIILPAQLLGKAQVDLRDLRLYDQLGTEQSYLIRRESDIYTRSSFKEYSIIERESEKDTISYLIFENTKRNKIDHIGFVVNNTGVRKKAILSGSNDLKKWLTIKDDYLLRNMSSNKKTTQLKTLNFPLSDYAYFKLEISDNIINPINISKIGYYDKLETKGNYTYFDLPVIIQIDSAKVSTIKVKSPYKMYMEKLKLDISGADMYSRYVKISKTNKFTDLKNKTKYIDEVITSFNINSNKKNEVKTGDLLADELTIKIYNKDSPPLKLEKLTASFLNVYLVAKLEKGKIYTLKYGNEILKSPNYDIAMFDDEIPKDIPKLTVSETRKIVKGKEKVKETNVFENIYFIWTAIALVGVIISLISFKMIKELGRES